MGLREISAKEIKGNLIKMIADEWMLVTAGDSSGFNTMTASWGMMGEMWASDVAVTVIRPQRYTFEFMEKNDYYTLCFFDDGFKKALAFCGAHSGRDCDKCKETGLTPVFENGYTYFEQAKTVVVCRKVYVSDVDPAKLTDASIDASVYPKKDYHRAYIGKIEKVLVK